MKVFAILINGLVGAFNLGLCIFNYTRYVENGNGFTLFATAFTGIAALFCFGLMFIIVVDG